METHLSTETYTREKEFSFRVKQISTSSSTMVGVADKITSGFLEEETTLIALYDHTVTRMGGK